MVNRIDGSLRVGDSERDEACTALREHAARGRIDLDELEARVERACQARTADQLAAVLRDLPRLSRRRRGWRPSGARVHTATLAVTVTAVGGGEWLASAPGQFWPAWTLLAWGLLGARSIRALLRDSTPSARRAMGRSRIGFIVGGGTRPGRY